MENKIHIDDSIYEDESLFNVLFKCYKMSTSKFESTRLDEKEEMDEVKEKCKDELERKEKTIADQEF